LARQIEEQELQHTQAAHQFPDRGKAAGLVAQLAVHGG
jgi:hypothetical protein